MSKCNCDFPDEFKVGIDLLWYTHGVSEDWTNYRKEIPVTCGVYMLVSVDETYKKRTVEYIGSAKNLYARLSSHDVLRVLRRLRHFVLIYFREYPIENYKEREAYWIDFYKPVINIMHNNKVGFN